MPDNPSETVSLFPICAMVDEETWEAIRVMTNNMPAELRDRLEPTCVANSWDEEWMIAGFLIMAALSIAADEAHPAQQQTVTFDGREMPGVQIDEPPLAYAPCPACDGDGRWVARPDGPPRRVTVAICQTCKGTGSAPG